MRHQVFARTKRGNEDEEYEDAFAADPVGVRFAVADGATESSFAKSWARLLVEEYVRLEEPLRWPAWLPGLRSRWLAEVTGRPMSWYGEMKLEQGAFATFLGVAFEGETAERGLWGAVAIGDSCLFQVRQGRCVLAFPMTRSEEFNTSPSLVGSRLHAGQREEDRETGAAGDWEAGDRFYLMTDALAHWCLGQQEAGQDPWAEMERVLGGADPSDDFGKWIETLRDERGLRNDDVTLMRIRP